MDGVYYAIYCKNININKPKGFHMEVKAWNNVKNSNNIVLLEPKYSVNDEPSEFFKGMQEQCNQVRNKFNTIRHFMVVVPGEILDLTLWTRELQYWIENNEVHLALSLPVGAYEFWSKLEFKLRYPEQLSVFLYIDQNIRQTLDLVKWLQEPVSAIVLSFGDEFEEFLSRDYIRQFLVMICTQRKPLITLTMDSEQCTKTADMILKYVKSLLIEGPNIMSIEEDVIRDPLQPLRDDLSLDIYEVFERDENKYKMYENAIKQALFDLDRTCYSTLTILVIGPGRGPLIDIVMRNSSQLKKPFKLVALEKNTTCSKILDKKNIEDWDNNVNIIYDDLRHFIDNNQCQVCFNLIISELLGSFACNELSPEILDDCEKIRFADTIIIPTSYLNYIQPIYSPVLCQMTNRIALEQPYVVNTKPYSIRQILDIYMAWDYRHPGQNSFLKEIHVVIDLPTKGEIVHGFLGYFQCNLYADFNIGIHPNQVGSMEYCSSWAPLYFALREYITDSFTFVLKRKFDKTSVWYEWGVNKVTNNIDGKVYRIGKN